MRKINVLTLIDSFIQGGAERVAVNTAAGLNKKRFNSYVCVTRHGGELEDILTSNKVPYIVLNRKSRFRDVYKFYKAIKFINQKKIDIIHSQKFGSNIWGYFLKSLSNAKVHIAHDHTGGFSEETKVWMLLRKFFLNKCHKVISISEEIKNRMITLGVKPQKLIILPNGIDTSGHEIDIDKNKKKRALSIGDDFILVGMVARLHPIKNHEMLLRAAKEIVLRKNNIRFLIIGDGNIERKRELQNMAQELRIGKYIKFIGKRSDVSELLQIMDIGVLTSNGEASPLVILEYLAAKLPVVATSVGGVREIIDNNKTGILVAPNDVKGFVDAILKLAEDRNFARSLGENGFNLVKEKFSFENYIKRIEGLYEEVLDNRS